MTEFRNNVTMAVYLAIVLNMMMSQHTVMTSHPWICPLNCSCDVKNRTYGLSLSVNCFKRFEHGDLTDMTPEIVVLLANAEARHLVELNIEWTFLPMLPPPICEMTGLVSLCLDCNRIQTIPDECFSNMKNLLLLTMARNLIEKLERGVFDGLQNLQKLVLSVNPITTIDPHVFSNASKLTHLNYIALDNTELKEVDSWPMIRLLSVNSNAEIDLSSSRLEKLTNNIKWQYQCKRNQFFKVLHLDNTRLRHITSIIKEWNLTIADTLCLTNAKDRQVQFSITFKDNLQCDCQDFPYYKLFALDNAMHFDSFASLIEDTADCNSPFHLTGRNPFSLKLDAFVCDVFARCPLGCNCVHQPATSMLFVNCSVNNMSTLPTELPNLPTRHTKYSIYITNNLHLRAFEFREYLTSTTDFQLTNSGLREINGIKTWKTLLGMKILLLHGNYLRLLPDAVQSLNVTSTLISLGHNPWSCECDNRWMKLWLISIKNRLLNVDDLVCDAPDRLRGRNLLLVPYDDFCLDPVTEAVRRAITFSLIATCGFIIASVATVWMIYCFRFKLFVHWKFHPFDRDECAGEDMEYDVFLSSSSDDNCEDVLRLVEALESHNYKICYHARDFCAGDTIESNICRAIVSSKRTLCLMTENFVRRFASFY